MSKRDIHLYIDDINNSIAKIEEYTDRLTADEFVADQKTIDAVVRNLSIIGEAVNNIPEEIKEQYAEVPWNAVIGMRNKIIHEYFGVDEDILWKTIKEDLPAFRDQIERLF
ncbi:MAG: DUF86 domain-containing protein [Candidatus Niyogibacteria bacterium]|nr:DUF86 domain-containing protein [Candidatus Niyogibacteria bacterium]